MYKFVGFRILKNYANITINSRTFLSLPEGTLYLAVTPHSSFPFSPETTNLLFTSYEFDDFGH
jgi:hypothetical protein